MFGDSGSFGLAKDIIAVNYFLAVMSVWFSPSISTFLLSATYSLYPLSYERNFLHFVTFWDFGSQLSACWLIQRSGLLYYYYMSLFASEQYI